jgi:hypothetical protein
MKRSLEMPDRKIKDRVDLGLSPSTSVEDWDCREVEETKYMLNQAMLTDLIDSRHQLNYLLAYGVEGWEFYAEAMTAYAGEIDAD